LTNFCLWEDGELCKDASGVLMAYAIEGFKAFLGAVSC